MSDKKPSRRQLEKELEKLRQENAQLRQLVQMLAGLVDSKAYELMKAARDSFEILSKITGGENR